jgi:hypothetical protein
MKTATLPAFRHCLRGLPDARLAAVLEAIRAADAAYGNPHRHAGIGLRMIGDFMECRDALGMGPEVRGLALWFVVRWPRQRPNSEGTGGTGSGFVVCGSMAPPKAEQGAAKTGTVWGKPTPLPRLDSDHGAFGILVTQSGTEIAGLSDIVQFAIADAFTEVMSASARPMADSLRPDQAICFFWNARPDAVLR